MASPYDKMFDYKLARDVKEQKDRKKLRRIKGMRSA